MLVADIDNLSIMTFEASDSGAFLHAHMAAVERLDDGPRETPVLRVLNAAGGFRLDIDVFEFEIFERRFGVSAHCECLLSTRSPDVGDMDVAEVRHSLFG